MINIGLDIEYLNKRIKGKDMKLEYITYMKKYGEYDITPENITDEQITQLWIYAV